MATSEPEVPSTPERRPPLARSIGFALLIWAVTLAANQLTNPNTLSFPVLAVLIFGIWFGGRYGGIKGEREWVTFVTRLLAVAFLLVLLLALGACVYAMALYG